MRNERSPALLGRADVRECGTLWYAGPDSHDPARLGIIDALIREVTPEDAVAVRRAMVRCEASQPDLIFERIRGHRLGYVVEGPLDASDSREILSYGWIARPSDTVDDLGFPLRLPPRQGWIYDCATIPQARGKGLYCALLRSMRMNMRAKALEHVWIGTAPRNWASQRGIARAGFHKVVDMDWSGMTETAYAVPGVPAELVTMLGVVFDEDVRQRAVPGGGIPWIEGIMPASLPTDDTAYSHFKRFQTVYGEQIHWTAAPDQKRQVTFTSSGKSALTTIDASFEELTRALERVAPGLPWLAPPVDAGV